jgi:hypothetical protein
LKTDSLTYAQITRDWDGLVNYLKLDSISIVGWSDGGLLDWNGCLNQKNKENCCNGCEFRPDSTAVNS